MPEIGNVEVAKTLHESATEDEQHKRRSERILEIVEALLLAIVAISTAWSGYQAAKWDGRQALLYGESSRLRIAADQIETRGGQERLYDITTFNSWAQAKFSGDDELAAVFERRFRPEYLVAFRAWIKLDPLHNPKAPPGPVFMPQYHNRLEEEGAKMQAQATSIFAAGTHARETGDDYVRTTVFLATVLFLIALAQRFTIKSVRIGLLCVAAVFLSVALFTLSTYPHI